MHAYSLDYRRPMSSKAMTSTLRLNYIEYQTQAEHMGGMKMDLRSKLVLREIAVFESEIALLALAP